jgi:hypothetical protein
MKKVKYTTMLFIFLLCMAFVITSCSVQHHSCPAYTLNQENMRDSNSKGYNLIMKNNYGTSFKGHTMEINTIVHDKPEPKKVITIHNRYFGFSHVQTYDVVKDKTTVMMMSQWKVPLKTMANLIHSGCNSISTSHNTKFVEATGYDKSQLEMLTINMQFNDISSSFILYAGDFNRNYNSSPFENHSFCTFEYKNIHDGLCLSGHTTNIDEKKSFANKINRFKHEIKGIDRQNLSNYLSNSTPVITGSAVTLNVKDNFCS